MHTFDRPLMRRASEAVRLVRERDLDPHDALALVVWPSPKLDALTREVAPSTRDLLRREERARCAA